MARSTTRAAAAHVLRPRTNLRFWVRVREQLRGCAYGVPGPAPRHEQRHLACSAFARACASGYGVHGQR